MELTKLSLSSNGKQAIVLTMLLTVMCPLWAFGQNVTFPMKALPIEQKMSELTKKKSWTDLKKTLETDKLEESTLGTQKQPSQFLNKIKKDQRAFSSGTDLSGGGTSVKITNSGGNSSKVLLDFYNFNNVPQKNSLPVILPRTEALKKLGIEKLQLESTRFLPDLKNQFQLWKSRSPIFVKYLEQAVQNISIYYTTYQIPKLDINTYFPDRNYNEELEPRSIAFYAKSFGIIVALKEFEQLSYENQKGTYPARNIAPSSDRVWI